MRLEFLLHAASPGEEGSRIIRDTTADVIECVLRLARSSSGAAPEWAEFFSDPRHQDWPLDRTVAALRGMREAVARHGAAWAVDRRWPASWGEPDELVDWLDGAVEDVRGQPAGTLFRTSVQPD